MKLGSQVLLWILSCVIALVIISLQILNQACLSPNLSFCRLDPIHILESRLLDLKFIMRGPIKPSGRVGILGIDDQTLTEFGRWPIDRKLFDPVIKNLKKRGVRWLAFDIVFSEPQRDSVDDLILLLEKSPHKNIKETVKWLMKQKNQDSFSDLKLYDALKEHPFIIQGFILNASSPSRFPRTTEFWQSQELNFEIPHPLDKKHFAHQAWGQPLLNIPLFLNLPHAKIAFLNNHAEMDGVIRTIQLAALVQDQQQLYFIPSLSLKLASEMTNQTPFVQTTSEPGFLFEEIHIGQTQIPILMDGSGKMYLNHYGPFKSFPHISFADAYHDRLPASLPEALIVGGTATGISDIRPSPFDALIQGVEHHAAAVENLITSSFVVRNVEHLVLEMFLSLILIFASMLLLTRSSLISFLNFIWVAGGLLGLGQRLFNQYQIIFHEGVLFVQWLIHYVFLTLYTFFKKEKEASHIRTAFKHYLHPSIIDELVKHPDSLKLAGEKKVLTVLFSDLRGFTSLSENLPPEKLSMILNEYFTPMSTIILETQGVLDKYIGDALMAFWGAPIPLANSPDRALAAGIEMMSVLKKLKIEKPYFADIKMGIGINTGSMIVGNMGSEHRFDFTVIGDEVNLASRLEGVTKYYGVTCICSESTYTSLQKPELFTVRELDHTRVKGKQKSIRIFEVMGFSNQINEQQKTIKSTYEKALHLYYQGLWSESLVLLENIIALDPEDGPSLVLINRIKGQQPPSHWDGIWTMENK